MGMASMSRMIFTAVGVCMLAFPAGCVMHEIYGGNAVPESELAFVEGYWHFRVLYDEELHIVSVDGKREGESSGWPYAYSVSLPSGKHWLQLAILRNSGVVAWCAFELTFEAQHRYKLERLDHDQFLLAHPVSSPFAASISMAVTAPGQPVQHLSAPAVCGRYWAACCACCRNGPTCVGSGGGC